ncbi:uncharacterized protein LOC141913032 [Tubulanus polymorphus]|uniref:uncharacterized protein LOC141913032 n=1 Tax=Tubulanus polymorphus TaxID=672921 RepID=UPI003DA54144
MNMDWNGGGRPPMSDAPNYQHHPPFHPIGLNTSLEKFLHQQNTSASSLLKSGPPGGAADLWDCPTIKSNSYYCWNLNDDSGFVDNSMTFNDSRQNFADRGSKERNDVKTDDDRVNVLLESAQIAFDAAVRKARFEPIHSPSWAKQNLPGAGKHTWTIFKPDEIREKFRIATPADASRPVDLSMKGTGSSSTSPKARPTILNKSTSSTSPRTVNIELVAANGFDVSELPLTRIKPSKSVVATDTSSKHKEKRKKKGKK